MRMLNLGTLTKPFLRHREERSDEAISKLSFPRKRESRSPIKTFGDDTCIRSLRPFRARNDGAVT